MTCKFLVYFVPLVFLGCSIVTAPSVEETIPEAVSRKINGSQLMLTDDLRNTRATIYQSNMPTTMQSQVLSYVTSAYSLSSDKMYICQLLQNYMDSYQPGFYWNVVINYYAVTFYSNYYAIVTQDTDELLIFGLAKSSSDSNKGVMTIKYIAVLLLIHLSAYAIN